MSHCLLGGAEQRAAGRRAVRAGHERAGRRTAGRRGRSAGRAGTARRWRRAAASRRSGRGSPARRGAAACARRTPGSRWRGAARNGTRGFVGGLAGLVARPVVLDLVVVPDRQQRVRGAHRPQVRRRSGRARTCRGTPAASAPRRRRWRRSCPGAPPRRRSASRRCSRRGRSTRSRSLLGGQRGVRRVVAGLVVLAGEEADPDRLARVGRARGAEAADRAVDRAGDEAVVVALARLEHRVLGAVVDRVAVGRARDRGLAVDHAAEVGVGGDLDLQARVARRGPRPCSTA